MVLRYQWRVFSYVYWMRNEYPPFEFTVTARDNGIDPASVDVEDPVEMNRWLVLVKWLLAIPQYIVLLFLGIALWVVLLITFFAVLFTGKWPEGMRNVRRRSHALEHARERLHLVPHRCLPAVQPRVARSTASFRDESRVRYPRLRTRSARR